MKIKQKFDAKTFLKLSIILVVICTLACDAGVCYDPKDWTKIDEHNFSKTFGLIDIEINPLSGLTGSSYIMPVITIHNRAKLPVVITGSVLKANDSEYIAKPFSKGGWEIVPSNETKKITMVFELNKSLGNTLKNSVELNITIKVGSELNEINIPMIKRYG
jgi:hypothetical protein